MKTERIKRYMIILLFGLAGLIMFFPFNFKNGQTCMMDRLLNSPLYTRHDLTYETRLHRYVVPYGLLWWGSIGLTAIFFNKIILLRKDYRN